MGLQPIFVQDQDHDLPKNQLMEVTHVHDLVRQSHLKSTILSNKAGKEGMNTLQHHLMDNL